jgi:hypothetical protein
MVYSSEWRHVWPLVHRLVMQPRRVAWRLMTDV